MRAVKLYEPGNLQVEVVGRPIIGADEVLVEVKAVGICGSDIPRVLSKGAYYEGLAIGHEFSGQIVEVGADIRDWYVGDRVTVAPLIPCDQCNYCKEGFYSLCDNYSYYGSRTEGAMADYIKVCPNNLLKLPDSVSYEEGAMVDPAANAIHGLWRGNFRKGDSIVVFGLGAIGLFAVQFARELGAETIMAVDIQEDKLELARAFGASLTVNALKQSPQELASAYDFTFGLDTSGSPEAQNQLVLMMNKRGRIVYLGISNAALTLSKESVNRLLRYEIGIYGSWNSFSKPFPGREWTYALELMEQRKLQALPIISHRFGLDEAPAVFQKIRNKEIAFNKIMFFPGTDRKIGNK